MTPLCFLARSTEAKTRKWSAMSARRDPDLLAVEPVGVAVAPRRGLQVAGVRPDARLGQPERRQLLATRLRDEPALALLLGAPLQEGQRVEPDVDALDDPERGVGTLQLLAQDREAEVVHPAAAVRLGDRGAQEARARPSSSNTSRWTSPFSSHSRMYGRISASAKARHALLHEPVLVGQGEIDHAGHRTRRRVRLDEARSRPTSRTPTPSRWTPPLTPAPQPDARPRPLFPARLEPRRGPSAVRHGRPRLPRLRERDRGHGARPRPSAGDGRDPRPGRPAHRADHRRSASPNRSRGWRTRWRRPFPIRSTR